MSTLLFDLIPKGHLILAGDLNSHFGSDEEEIRDSSLFGNILHHLTSNSNGDDMFMICELHRLKVLTTMYHRSTRVTWTNNHRTSQIDHVLLPEKSDIIVNNLNAVWSKISTDHKLLSWAIKIPNLNLKHFQFSANFLRNNRMRLMNGFCIPASCSTEKVVSYLNENFLNRNDLQALRAQCRTNDSPSFNALEITAT